MNEVGRIVIAIGVFFLLLGFIVILSTKFTQFPKLPGDIYLKKGNFVFYFPWVTTLIVSIIVNLIINFFMRR